MRKSAHGRVGSRPRSRSAASAAASSRRPAAWSAAASAATTTWESGARPAASRRVAVACCRWPPARCTSASSSNRGTRSGPGRVLADLPQPRRPPRPVHAEGGHREAQVPVVGIAHRPRHQAQGRPPGGGREAPGVAVPEQVADLRPELRLPHEPRPDRPDRGKLPAERGVAPRFRLFEDPGSRRQVEPGQAEARRREDQFPEEQFPRVSGALVAPGGARLVADERGHPGRPPPGQRPHRIPEQPQVGAPSPAEVRDVLGVEQPGGDPRPEAARRVRRGERTEEFGLDPPQVGGVHDAHPPGGLDEPPGPVLVHPRGIKRGTEGAVFPRSGNLGREEPPPAQPGGGADAVPGTLPRTRRDGRIWRRVSRARRRDAPPGHESPQFSLDVSPDSDRFGPSPRARRPRRHPPNHPAAARERAGGSSRGRRYRTGKAPREARRREGASRPCPPVSGLRRRRALRPAGRGPPRAPGRRSRCRGRS